MKGTSHIATNIFSAVAVNSFFYIVDKSYSWHQLMQIISSPQLNVALHSEQFLHKLTLAVIAKRRAYIPSFLTLARFGSHGTEESNRSGVCASRLLVKPS